MKTGEVLGFGLGFLIGYTAVKMDWGKKLKPLASTTVNTAGLLASDVKNVAVDTVKMSKCEIAWNENSKMARYASAEAYNNAHNTFIEKCMATA